MDGKAKQEGAEKLRVGCGDAQLGVQRCGISGRAWNERRSVGGAQQLNHRCKSARTKLPEMKLRLLDCLSLVNQLGER